jgi:ATP synthase protein I
MPRVRCPPIPCEPITVLPAKEWKRTRAVVAAEASNRSPQGVIDRSIFVCSQPVIVGCQILDLIGPNQYGPRASGAAERPRSCLTRGCRSMADDARDNSDRRRPPPDEAALSARFERLGDRLGKFHPGRPSVDSPGQRPVSDPSAIARGFRLSTELVAGVLVGAGIGWLLDKWLGISPWGMIVFLLLGFAAGVLNVMRAAGVAQNNEPGPPGSKR